MSKGQEEKSPCNAWMASGSMVVGILEARIGGLGFQLGAGQAGNLGAGLEGETGGGVSPGGWG